MENNIVKIQSAGADAKGIIRPVTIEAEVTEGVGIHLVGLTDAQVKESLLRTITALQSLGFSLPGQKIVINVTPADMHKRGTGYDLPIAIGILQASGQIRVPDELLKRCVFYGQLGLDGTIKETGERIGANIVTEMWRLAADRPLALVADRWTALEAAIFPKCAIPYGFGELSALLRVLQKDTQGSLAGSSWIVWNTHTWKAVLDDINVTLDLSEYPL